MAKIELNNVSVEFSLDATRVNSLKEWFAQIKKNLRSKNKEKFHAVKDICLEIASGDRLGIVGNNGAGKSTLLKIICGVYKPTIGEVNSVGKIAPLLELGAGFHPDFTGRENIYLNGALMGISKKELKNLEDPIIDFSGIREFIDIPVKYYSTGMYLRLAFALATAKAAEILILDEMFAGGDVAFVERAREKMFGMIDQSNIMILVSHDHSLINDLCNRVIWMEHGRIIMDGEPSEVLSKYLGSNA